MNVEIDDDIRQSAIRCGFSDEQIDAIMALTVQMEVSKMQEEGL